MDQRCKKLTEQIEDEILDKFKIEDSKREAFRGRGAPLEWRLVRKSKKYRIRKWREDCWARIFALFGEYNLQRLESKQEESAEEGEMKQQRRMKIMKDLTKKIRSKERMDAESRWWVTGLLAADCEKAWIHPGWEDTMQPWCEWYETMKKQKKMRRKRWRRCINKKVAQIINSAEGSAGLLQKISKPTAWRGGARS